MNNKVIKVLDREHGKKVIEFWKQYCDTDGYEGINIGYYYGIVNGEFDVWKTSEIRKYNAEIIELPEEKTCHRVMLVSDDNVIFDRQRVVFMEKCGGFLAWANAKTLEEAKKETNKFGTWITITYATRYFKNGECTAISTEKTTTIEGSTQEDIINYFCNR